MECRENRGQSESRGIVREANSQPPRAAVRDELYAADGILDLIEDVARLDKEIGARRCKSGKTMPCPRKQAGTHLLFEPCYLFGDRRLRDLEPIGGATEIQLLGHDDEVAEMAELDVSVPNTIRRTGAGPRSRFSCNSHLYHRQLNRCTLERKAAVR